jgi:carbonic anhydrase
MMYKRLTLFLAACSMMAMASSQHVPVTTSSPHWNYDMESKQGPSGWGNLPGYATCGNGHHQSPINIDRAHSIRHNITHKLYQSYHRAEAAVVVNNGHTVQVNKHLTSFLYSYVTPIFDAIAIGR